MNMNRKLVSKLARLCGHDTDIFCTIFSFNYSTYSIMYYFNNLVHCHNIYFHPDMMNDGTVRPLPKVFSTSQRFSTALKSRNLCFLNYFTSWAQSIVTLSSWNIPKSKKKNPLLLKIWSFILFIFWANNVAEPWPDRGNARKQQAPQACSMVHTSFSLLAIIHPLP